MNLAAYVILFSCSETRCLMQHNKKQGKSGDVQEDTTGQEDGKQHDAPVAGVEQPDVD